MNVLSLFSGIGGLELGLAKHWPEVARHDDVRTTVEWWRGTVRPPIHLICGGFPCQPFSLAGRQLGISDERWMWPAMAHVVRELRPQYVLVENVAALVRDRNAFGIVLADLAALGFDAEWSVLYATEFGAPTPRERVYLLAYTPGVDGESRHLLGAGGDGGAPLAAGGLLGLAVPERRRAADEWLAREPRVARLVDGVPQQVERNRVMGNAVVPQVAEHIGRLILNDFSTSGAAA